MHSQPETRKRKSISFTDLQTATQDDDIKDWLEGQEMVKFEGVKSLDIRPVGPLMAMARHWPKSIKTGTTCPPCYCPRFDMATQKFDTNKPCPLHEDFEDKAQKVLIFSCIVRQWQTGKKAKQNPVGVLVLPGSLQGDLVSIVGINKADISDYDKGCDLRVTYDKDAPGPKKWSVQRADRTPLNDDERDYDVPDLDAKAPDFGDAAFTADYVKSLKVKMAKWGYYVKPLNNGKAGWDAFKKSVDGQPYKQFPELSADGSALDVEPRRNDVAPERNNQTRRLVAVSDDDLPVQRARPVDTGARAARTPAKPVEEVSASDAEDAPAGSLSVDEEDGAPFDLDETPATKPAKKAVVANTAGPEEHAVWTKKHSIQWAASGKADGEDRPDCFSVFAGGPKCRYCPFKPDCLVA